MKGKKLIVTDGTTLLGADDKSRSCGNRDNGPNAARPSGKGTRHHPDSLYPDEEVGRGVDHFDVGRISGGLCPILWTAARWESWNTKAFNAAGGKAACQWIQRTSGQSKNKMLNAILLAQEFQSLLPVFETPAATEGYEGFYHADRMTGTVESAQVDYIIRDHARELFEKKKAYFRGDRRFPSIRNMEKIFTLVVAGQLLQYERKDLSGKRPFD